MQEIATALAKAQASLKAAPFDKSNPHFKNKYASLASVIDTIRKPLADNGLAYTQATQIRDGHLVLVTTLHHTSGQSIAAEYPLPSVSKPQELGSALTYARRYSLSALVCIAAVEDDDGEGARRGGQVNKTNGGTGEGFVTDKQAETIRALVTETKVDLDKFLAWAGAECVPDIPAAKYADCVAMLEAKREKINATAHR